MKFTTVVAGAMLLLLAVGPAAAQETQPAGQAAGAGTVKKQTVCPIEGGQISTNLFADFGGKRVYFCCGGCPAEFKKDPAKYIAKMEKDGVTLDKTPSADPAKKPNTNATVAPVRDRAAQ